MTAAVTLILFGKSLDFYTTRTPQIPGGNNNGKGYLVFLAVSGHFCMLDEGRRR